MTTHHQTFDPRTALRHHVEEARSITGYRFTVANVSQISKAQAQAILDYCHDRRLSQRNRSLVITFVFVLSRYVGVDETLRILPPPRNLCHKNFSYVVCHIADYPPQDIHAFMTRLRAHELLFDFDPHATLADIERSPALRLLTGVRGASSIVMRYDAMLTMLVHHSYPLYQLTSRDMHGFLKLCTTTDTTVPTSDDELCAYVTIGSCHDRRRSSVGPDDWKKQLDWAQTQDHSLVMYDLCTVLLPSEQDSDRVSRVPDEITAPSIRGLVTSSRRWSLAYAEYALSHWSLDEALNRIVRAVNLRVPLSCQQFLTVCHEYESIQHLPDSWVMDILGLEEATVAYDAFDVALYPGDMVGVKVYHQDTVVSCIVTDIDHQTGAPYLSITKLGDDATDMKQRRASEVLKLHHVSCHVH